MFRSFSRIALGLASIAITGLFAAQAAAIDINLIYRPAGQSIGGVATATAQPANAVGGGQLQTIVDLAAQYWESVYGDSHTVTLEYGWAPLAAAGTHNLISEGGSPHRETYGTVRFDSDQTTTWFLDPTPPSNSEFTTFTTYSANLGGGTMTTGLEWTGGTGLAAQFDLLTTAIHEVGHSLGLSASNNAYAAETGTDFAINVTSPRAFAGAAIPVETGTSHLDMLHPLMRSSRPSGVRRFASEADILANAQVSQFTQVNLTPALPEPALGGVILIAGAAICVQRRPRGLAASAASVPPQYHQPIHVKRVTATTTATQSDR